MNNLGKWKPGYYWLWDLKGEVWNIGHYDGDVYWNVFTGKSGQVTRARGTDAFYDWFRVMAPVREPQVRVTSKPGQV